MIPSLFTFSLLMGAVLTMTGGLFLILPDRLRPVLEAYPRHRMTGIVTMVLGGVWFIWNILQLGPADFGDYKELMALLFAATLVAAILYVQDFLAVRGTAILVLLIGNVGLKSAYGLYDIPERLLLVSLIYVFIVGGIIYGLMPYLMRDTVAWLMRRAGRLRLLGALVCFSGVSLFAISFMY